MFFHGATGFLGVAGQDGADDGVVLGVRVVDVAPQHGNGREQFGEGGLCASDGLDEHGRPRQGRNGEVEAGVREPMRGLDITQMPEAEKMQVRGW